MYRSDAEAAIKKFKKSLSAVVAATILKSFDGDGGGGGKKGGGFEGGMSYDAFCDVMNGLAVAEKKEKEGESKTNEAKSANKTGASEKRQRRPSKKRKN